MSTDNMTHIEVSATVRIVRDTHSWAIARLENYKGGTRWRQKSWYPKLTQAIEHCIEDDLFGNEERRLDAVDIANTWTAYLHIMEMSIAAAGLDGLNLTPEEEDTDEEPSVDRG